MASFQKNKNGDCKKASQIGTSIEPFLVLRLGGSSDNRLQQQRHNKGRKRKFPQKSKIVSLDGDFNDDTWLKDHLPHYQPCDILEELAASLIRTQCHDDDKVMTTTSEEVEDKRYEYQNFVNRLYRDESISSYCMLIIFQLVQTRSFSLSFESSSNGPDSDDKQDNAFLPSVVNEWHLTEGWTYIQHLLSWMDCCKLFYRIQHELHVITLDHPLKHYASTTLFRLSETECSTVASLIGCPQVSHLDTESSSKSQIDSTQAAKQRVGSTKAVNRLRLSQQLQQIADEQPHRKVGILLQHPLQTMSENQPESDPKPCHKALSEKLLRSCQPNAALELSVQPSIDPDNDPLSFTKLQCALIALYDLEPDEAIYLPRNFEPQHADCACLGCRYDRGALLLPTFDSKLCAYRGETGRSYCENGGVSVKSSPEQVEDGPALEPSLWIQALRLGHAYFQKENFDAAVEWYRFIVGSCQNQEGTQEGIIVVNKANSNRKSITITPRCKPPERLVAEAWHALGAIALTKNKFVQAQQIWKAFGNGKKSDTTGRTNLCGQAGFHHPGIELQLEKQCAYQYFQQLPSPQLPSTSNKGSSLSIATENRNSMPSASTATNIEYDSYSDDLHGKNRGVFVTKYPVVSEPDCRQILKWTFDHVTSSSNNGSHGWSTNRHYAVPTMDVAVHTVPKLLEWFQQWMENVAHPLLIQQFCSTQAIREADHPEGQYSGQPRRTNLRFYVHDAFVVRYDGNVEPSNSSSPSSNGSKNNTHLPLHFDESTHSMVLTLNDEFEGGGTYLYHLDKTLLDGGVGAVKPGTLLSFAGNRVFHGGNVVTKGVRYILAVFMYLDKAEGSSSDDLNGALAEKATSCMPFLGLSSKADDDSSAHLKEKSPMPDHFQKEKITNLFKTDQKNEEKEKSQLNPEPSEEHPVVGFSFQFF